MKPRQLFLAGMLLVFAQGAFAQQAIDVNGVLDLVKQAIVPAIGKLTTQATTWLGIFAVLQFFITNYSLLKSDGDIQSVIAKMFGAVAWVGVCLYIINNGPQFLQGIGDQMMSLLGMDLPSPASIVTKTVVVTATLGAAAIGVSAIPLVGDTAGMFLIYITLAIMAIGLLFAFKIFMLQLEVMLIALLAPLSFAFLGLNSLKDQGIAPFKALISFAYRVILLTIILSGFNQVSDIVSNVISAIDKEQLVLQGAQKVVQTVLSALGAYLLLAYLAFKSDSIAATLASGSTSMGTGDVAQAAATGAALGAAVATGGATAAATGGKAPQAMSDFMSKMTGGGSVSNASPMGSGGGDAPTFTPPAPSLSAGPSGGGVQSTNMSTGAGGASSSKPPSRSQDGSAVASGRYGPDLPGEAQSGTSKGSDGATNSPGSSAAQNDQPHSKGGDATSSKQMAESSASAPAQSSSPAESAPGSGRSAGVSGNKSGLETDLSKLVEHLSSQGPRRPSLGERLGDANRHVSQEQAGTHVSVNTHHTD